MLLRVMDLSDQVTYLMMKTAMKAVMEEETEVEKSDSQEKMSGLGLC